VLDTENIKTKKNKKAELIFNNDIKISSLVFSNQVFLTGKTSPRSPGLLINLFSFCFKFSLFAPT